MGASFFESSREFWKSLWGIPPLFFQRVRKRFVLLRMQIFQFWECASD
jgi:hypothetical protein